MERAPPDGLMNASGTLAGEAAAAGGARGFSAAWTAVLAALMALLIVATVLGNALVMLAFVADSSLRTQNNFFLLNLAISDFLVGAFCIPLYVPYVLTGRWTFGRGLCKLWLVVDYLLCASSVFNIVLISYDRFLSVTRAVSYRAQQGDTRRAVRKMALVWVLAFLLYGPAILSWEYLSGGSSIPEGHCYAEFFYNWYFLITASTLEFFTPFLSVTFFNLSIYLNIQRRTRLRLDGGREAGPEPPPDAQPSPPPAPPSCWGCWPKGHGEAMPLHSSGSSSRGTERPRSLKRGSKPSASSASLEKRMKMVSQSITQRFRLSRDKKVAKSLAIIVSIFGLCWAPYTLLMIIRAACHGRCIPDYCVERLGKLEASLLLPLWMFSGRWRRRKHVCELDVPWMFNQERQNCRGARGWIGRCGLPRPPPSVLQLPAEPRQLLLPAPPPGLGRWPCPACPVCTIRIWGWVVMG
ncbi:histamine H3 receptor isoform H3E [Rattus norvegicus]|uniref:Histamine H3 receptor n=1 Tax=Rattus norvegicus TaxID=10116 RepID=Q2VJ17_RAT|nr:histamine H3 receptor isoform H3E [Rattus norvegicus]AAZ93638.1 histamine H3 receptor isoform E [Rattus norvegicus]|eukprot:NP_001257496.1 histamine H3 receptor isoform H3E [Rattus norvegicus]